MAKCGLELWLQNVGRRNTLGLIKSRRYNKKTLIFINHQLKLTVK